MHILFAAQDYDTDRWVADFAAALPEHTVSAWRAGVPAPQARAAIVWQPPRALFEQTPSLEAVFNLGAGVDALLDSGVLPPAVKVIRLEDAGMALQMAEYCLYAVLRAARGFDAYDQAQRRGEWLELPAMQRSLWPVGVLGLGAVGKRVAQVLANFGFPVAGWSRSGGQVPNVQVYAGAQALPAFLARTRVLVNVLPLTDGTRDMLNRDTLRQLMPDSHLINVGRGAHLVEPDLLRVLEEGPLTGATLDVFRTEPLPAEHAFWRHPAIRITPHVAGRTLHDETIAQIAAKIRQFAAGQAPSGLVQRDRGY